MEYPHLHGADRTALIQEARRLEEERILGRAKRQAFQELSLNRRATRSRSVDGGSSPPRSGPRPLSLLSNGKSDRDGMIGLGIRRPERRSTGSRPSSITYARSSGSFSGYSPLPTPNAFKPSTEPQSLEVLVEAITPSTTLNDMTAVQERLPRRSRLSLDSVYTTAERRFSDYPAQSSSDDHSYGKHSTYSWATSFSGETSGLRAAAHHVPAAPAVDVSDTPPELDTPARETQRRKRIVAIAHTARLLEGTGSRHPEEEEQYLDLLQGSLNKGAAVFGRRPMSSPTKMMQRSHVSSISSRSFRDSYASSLHDLVLQQQGSRLMQERAWLRDSPAESSGTPWGGDFEPSGPSDFFTSVPLRSSSDDHSHEISPPFEFDEQLAGKALRRVNGHVARRPEMPISKQSHAAEIVDFDEAGPSTYSKTQRQPSASAWWDQSASVATRPSSMARDELDYGHGSIQLQPDFHIGEGVEVGTTTSITTMNKTPRRSYALEPEIEPLSMFISTTSSGSMLSRSSIRSNDQDNTSNNTRNSSSNSGRGHITSSKRPRSPSLFLSGESGDVSLTPSDRAFFDTILQTPLRRHSTLTSSMPSRRAPSRQSPSPGVMPRPGRSRSMTLVQSASHEREEREHSGRALGGPLPASLSSSHSLANMVSMESSQPPVLAPPIMLQHQQHGLLSPAQLFEKEKDGLTGSEISWRQSAYKRRKMEKMEGMRNLGVDPGRMIRRQSQSAAVSPEAQQSGGQIGQALDHLLPAPDFSASPQTPGQWNTPTPPSTWSAWTPRTPSTPQSQDMGQWAQPPRVRRRVEMDQVGMAVGGEGEGEEQRWTPISINDGSTPPLPLPAHLFPPLPLPPVPNMAVYAGEASTTSTTMDTEKREGESESHGLPPRPLPVRLRRPTPPMPPMPPLMQATIQTAPCSDSAISASPPPPSPPTLLPRAPTDQTAQTEGPPKPPPSPHRLILSLIHI